MFNYIAYDADTLVGTECLPPSVHSMRQMRQIPEREGWACTGIVNLDMAYAAWYGRFLARMDENQEALAATRSPELFDAVRKKYADMLGCLEQGTLGDALHVHALA